MERQKVKASLLNRTINTKGIGQEIKKMVKVNKSLNKEFTKENIQMVKNKEKDSFLGRMERVI